MDKKRLHRRWARLRKLKPWYFLLVALISGLVCLAALRANNLRMISLREAVYAADKNNGDTEKALRDLREHVYSHMNTSLSSGENAVHPPVQLKYTYERLVQAQQASAGTSNSVIYTEAQQHCERTIPQGVSGGVRLGCIQAYVKQRSPETAQSVPKNLYQFDFVSPAWSPDLAGWSLVAAVAALALALKLWLYQNVLRYLLRK